MIEAVRGANSFPAELHLFFCFFFSNFSSVLSPKMLRSYRKLAFHMCSQTQIEALFSVFGFVFVLLYSCILLEIIFNSIYNRCYEHFIILMVYLTITKV